MKDMLKKNGRDIVTTQLMTPNMGQGACMAIESAYVLSRSLKEQADIRSALRRYESQRHARTACLAAAAETLLTSISGALTPDERKPTG